MKHKTEDFVKPCNCRSTGECSCNTFSEIKAFEKAVKEFSKEMNRKFFKKALQGYRGWDDEKNFPTEGLIKALKEHAQKDDMIDIAVFALMIWNRQD